MHADVERALAGDFDFLRDVRTASRQGKTQTLIVAYIVHAVCKSLEILVSHWKALDHQIVDFVQIALRF